MKNLCMVIACVFFLEFPSHLTAQEAPAVITTIAGSGTLYFLGDGGPATLAGLAYPHGVAVDAKGNLYIAEGGRIRRVSPDGIITTIAGTGKSGFSGDGGPATQASLSAPSGVAVDAKGNIYIADTLNQRIRRVSTDGIITTVAGTGDRGFSRDGGPAIQAKFNEPIDIAVDINGNVYIADRLNRRIRRVSTDGIITTIAGTGESGFSGDGKLAIDANLNTPYSVAVDAKGNVYVAEGSRIRRVSTDGIITTIAGSDNDGFAGDGGLATRARLNSPRGVTIDTKGNIYIADTDNYRIRRVAPDSIITSIVGSGLEVFSGDGGPATRAGLKSPSRVAVDAVGVLYIIDNYRIRRVKDTIITTFAGGGVGDGGPAIQAGLSPRGVAVDAKGNIYIADTFNQRIRRMGPNGIITTIAGSGGDRDFSGDGGPATQASLGDPYGVAVDSKGNVYIAEHWNHRIRRVGPDGIITTFAGTGTTGFSGDGGPAIQANLSDPSGVAVDTKGVVYIVDEGNYRIRRVGLDGIITTFTGTGDSGLFGKSGDKGPATNASLNPSGVAVDAAGVVYIAESSSNHRVRRVGLDGVILTGVHHR